MKVQLISKQLILNPFHINLDLIYITQIFRLDSCMLMSITVFLTLSIWNIKENSLKTLKTLKLYYAEMLVVI